MIHSGRCEITVLIQCRCYSGDDVYKLWRIFNVIAEREASDGVDCEEAALPVTVNADELELIVQRLGATLRTAVTYDACGSTFNFAEFLRTVETNCSAGRNSSVVSSAVGELYDDIIANVLKKVSDISLVSL